MNFLYVWLALRARFVCVGRIHFPSVAEFRPPLIRWYGMSIPQVAEQVPLENTYGSFLFLCMLSQGVRLSWFWF